VSQTETDIFRTAQLERKKTFFLKFFSSKVRVRIRPTDSGMEERG
jgi:hypothetical protein